jgi:hypothetical protein
MRAAYLYGAGDVRVIDVARPGNAVVQHDEVTVAQLGADGTITRRRYALSIVDSICSAQTRSTTLNLSATG